MQLTNCISDHRCVICKLNAAQSTPTLGKQRTDYLHYSLPIRKLRPASPEKGKYSGNVFDSFEMWMKSRGGDGVHWVHEAANGVVPFVDQFEVERGTEKPCSEQGFA